MKYKYTTPFKWFMSRFDKKNPITEEQAKNTIRTMLTQEEVRARGDELAESIKSVWREAVPVMYASYIKEDNSELKDIGDGYRSWICS